MQVHVACRVGDNLGEPKLMARAEPPPLKARSKRPPPKAPPLPKSKVLADVLSALETGIPDEPEAPAEQDAAEGEWLFKENDVVKGPVPATVLVQRITEEGLEPGTKIAREMGKWVALSEVAYFADAIKAVEEKRRIEEELARVRALRSRRTVVRLAVMALIAIIPLITGAWVGRAVMIAKPWDDTDAWAQRSPPLVDLPPPPPRFAKVEEPKPVEEPPPSETAEGEPSDDAKNAADDDDGKGKKGRKKGKKGKKAKTRDAAKEETTKVAEAPASSGSDKDLPRTLTQAQVMSGLNKGASGFKKCVKDEMDRNPDMPARITLAFSVANDGKAINVKLLERQVRDGPLASCIQKSMAGLRWQKFYGERPYAEVPFNISKPKPPPGGAK